MTRMDPPLPSHGLRALAVQQLARVTRRFHPRGTDRALFAIYSPDRRQHDHIETVLDYDKGLHILCDTASWIEWRMFFFGHYEPEIAELIRALVQSGGVAADVGANVGCHTLIMADTAGEGGAVLAFEPHPQTFERLNKNLELNAVQNVRALRCALGDAPGTVTLYAPTGPTPRASSATLGVENLPLKIGDREISIGEYPVAVRRLDDVIGEYGLRRLDLMKIDVEGHEMPVLLGARETIERMRPQVIFEYTREFWPRAGYAWGDALAYFDALEYELLRIPARGRPAPIGPGEPANGNVLARPRRSGLPPHRAPL